MKLLANMTVNTDWLDDDADYVSLEITPDDAKSFLRLARTVKRLKVYSINDFDYTPEFLNSEYTETTFRSECTMLVVADNYIYWKGYVKHSDPVITWECSPIKTEFLKWLVKNPDTELSVSVPATDMGLRILKADPTELPLILAEIEEEDPDEHTSKLKDLIEDRLRRA